ncbi:MAG: hypothetical protein JWR61_5649 [Ferruginibacter sp.]|uniref:hypothetical protein n=1 Tax=Ferruginibacter sp. TaxID=1940288 RepID=UPI00265A81E6|nr:hypothetical protein [Ferruginibacter sp.]MDB5280694.1 hypothetical protein [Ferruginibacter sp.]
MKKFKMFIVDDERTDGGTMKVDNGAVISTSERWPLPNSPDGWNDIAIGWQRNITNHGVVRNFSLKLGFVKEGAKILRSIFLNQNVERKLFILFTQLHLKLTPTTFAYQYKFLYKGDLDFSSLIDDNFKITINIMEGGISKLLKANEGTEYPIPMDDPDAINVYCDGISLQQKNNFAIVDGVAYEEGTTATNLSLLNSEGVSSGTVAVDEYFEQIDPFNSPTALASYIATSSNFFFKNENTTPIVIEIPVKVGVKFKVSAGHPSWLEQKIIASWGEVFQTIPLLYPDPATVYDYSPAFTITVPPDGKLFLITISLTEMTSGYSYEFTDGSSLQIKYVTRFRPTFVKMFTLYDYYRKLTGKITGDPEDAVSQLLFDNKNICITCGDAIRGFTTAKIKSKMTDLFKAANVQFNAGMGVEGNKLTLEAKQHYYDSSNPFPLGEIKQRPKIQYAVDFMANTFKFGSEAKDYTDINGRDEFNNTYLYSSPITRIVSEFNMVSPYRRDSYGFEYTRINFDGKTTTDTDSDNDVWLVNVGKDVPYNFALLNETAYEVTAPHTIKIPLWLLQPGTQITLASGVNAGIYTVTNTSWLVVGFTYVTVAETLVNETVTGTITTSGISAYALKRGVYDEITGLLSPGTVFNLEDMTVADIIRKHGNWIRSMMQGFENKLLPFQTTEKNDKVYTRQGAFIRDLNADIVIRDLDAPLFIPKYMEIEVKVPINMPQALENNPSKCFSFVFNGAVYKGFLMQAGINLSTNASQVFKLLSSADNDFRKLL